ncbi:hypothetical protein BJY01DRAFT_241813 [Aspergillus pseudoustus]|uniref:HTH APSES-type domain-containing protein n=1 Tax=Aspergillus pseudoustus TaxID=1810923 RepID=A0ABR4L1T4_9EURO
MAKDAPIFTRGRPKGEVRYTPHEERSDFLAKQHKEFRIHPFGDIAAYPRHIPYNSDKKTFQELTGRESFEVFQYTFQLPGEDKVWTVMWDYNIGLVRTTHLFKCNDYSKTTPAKMLNQNPGLRDICHSITGGALAAQGYWMPFEAAKAVSATFCWKIRYALTPLFGPDFPELCAHPNDRSRFGRMIIDPSIVRDATERAHYYRIFELRSTSLHHLQSGYRPSSAGDRLPIGRHILPKSHHHYRRSDTSTERSLGYGSSPEYSSGTEPYCLTPISPVRSTFTPVNTPRSRDLYTGLLPSPHQVLASLSVSTIPSSHPSNNIREGNPIVVDGSDVDAESLSDEEYTTSTLDSGSNSSVATNDRPSPYLDADDDPSYRDTETDGDADPDYRVAKGIHHRKRGRVQPAVHGREHEHGHGSDHRQHPTDHSSYARPSRLQCEVSAAHALLSLHMQDTIGSDLDADADMVDDDNVLFFPPRSQGILPPISTPRSNSPLWSSSRKRRRASA